MNYQLLGKFIGDRMLDRSLYWLALIVGTVINCYGHLLVPWMRSGENPFILLQNELEIRPVLTVFTILITYTFPFGVALYSSVSSRYKNRRFESIAEFPDQRPDPVFRADRSGRLLEVGAETQKFFDLFGITSALDMIGEKTWSEIVSDETGNRRFEIVFDPEGARYVSAHSHSANKNINIYLTRLPD
jgi:hypothetical protein